MVSFDGKGVPVRPEARQREGTKKEALGGAVYRVNEQVRTAEQVVKALVFPEALSVVDKEQMNANDHARQIHYQARLAKSKEEVFKRTFHTMIILN